MKTLIFITLLIVSSMFVQAMENQPKLVSTDYHTGYIPDGFDTNDNVQIVGEGLFSNTCMRPANFTVRIDKQNKKIHINPRAYEYQGQMCAMVLNPYSQEINLGLLSAGSYDVIQHGLYKAKLGQLNIRLAPNSEPDEYIYAPVSEASWNYKNGRGYITLKGSFTSTCWSMRAIQVDIQKEKNVIVVQPVSNIKKDTACADRMVPYEKTFAVEGLDAGRYLLHVRSTNAKAVNNLVNVY